MMSLVPRQSRRILGIAVVVAASVALHVGAFWGIAGSLPAADAPTSSPPRPVSVRLVPPPAPPAPPVVAASSPRPPAAAVPVPQPRPTPRPPATTRPPAVVPAGPLLAPVAVSPDAFAMPDEADAPDPGPGSDGLAAGLAAGPVDEPGGRGPGSGASADAAPVSQPPPPDRQSVAEAATDADPLPPPMAGTAAQADAVDAIPGPLPALPGPRTQRFRVYWGDHTDERSVARLEYRLEHDGARYEIRTVGQGEGLIALVYRGVLSQVSSGRIGPAGLEPMRYVEQRGSRPERAVAFDPQGSRLLPVGGEAVALPPGTQDRLSVLYQVGLLARAAPDRFVAGSHHHLPVATMRGVRRERFDVVGDEVLMAPGGPIRALHLHRPADAGSGEPRIDLWLGYDFEMLPVRLRLEDPKRRVLDHLIEREG